MRQWLLMILTFAIGMGFVAADQVPEAEVESASTETFFEAIDVNIINVDIVVVDREGNRVPDLAADAFRVFEDGKAMEVVNGPRISTRGRSEDSSSQNQTPYNPRVRGRVG